MHSRLIIKISPLKKNSSRQQLANNHSLTRFPPIFLITKLMESTCSIMELVMKDNSTLTTNLTVVACFTTPMENYAIPAVGKAMPFMDSESFITKAPLTLVKTRITTTSTSAIKIIGNTTRANLTRIKNKASARCSWWTAINLAVASRMTRYKALAHSIWLVKTATLTVFGYRTCWKDEWSDCILTLSLFPIHINLINSDETLSFWAVYKRVGPLLWLRKVIRAFLINIGLRHLFVVLFHDSWKNMVAHLLLFAVLRTKILLNHCLRTLILQLWHL